jgi:hypothetical protein
MASSTGDARVVVSAYRSLYKAGLKAIRKSVSASFALRSLLRRSFREEAAATYSEERVRNTLAFLENASRYRGVEHKVVKNILHVRYWRERESGPTRMFVYVSDIVWLPLMHQQYQGAD